MPNTIRILVGMTCGAVATRDFYTLRNSVQTHHIGTVDAPVGRLRRHHVVVLAEVAALVQPVRLQLAVLVVADANQRHTSIAHSRDEHCGASPCEELTGVRYRYSISHDKVSLQFTKGNVLLLSNSSSVRRHPLEA